MAFTVDERVQSTSSAERLESAILLPDSSQRRLLLPGVDFSARKLNLCRGFASVPQTDDDCRRQHTFHVFWLAGPQSQ